MSEFVLAEKSGLVRSSGKSGVLRWDALAVPLFDCRSGGATGGGLVVGVGEAGHGRGGPLDGVVGQGAILDEASGERGAECVSAGGGLLDDAARDGDLRRFLASFEDASAAGSPSRHSDLRPRLRRSSLRS